MPDSVVPSELTLPLIVFVPGSRRVAEFPLIELPVVQRSFYYRRRGVGSFLFTPRAAIGLLPF